MSVNSSFRARALGALLAVAALPVAASTVQAAPATSGPLAIPGNTVWTGDYETGSTSQWAGCQRSGAWSINVQSQLKREGNYAARYEVRDGDTPIDANERAECQHPTGEVEGADRWYSWSTYFAPDFPMSNAVGWAFTNGGWGTFTQWHASSRTGSPPVGLFLDRGKIVLKVHRQSAPGTGIGAVDPWGTDLAPNVGRWVDFAMHVKWSGSDSTGSIELWMDGVKQKMNWPFGGAAASYGGLNAEKALVRTMIPGYSNYIKQGFYRWAGFSGTAAIYQDAFRMTDGKASGPYPTPEETPAPPPPPPPSAAISIAMSPATASVLTGASQQFTASGGSVTWRVNGVTGGNGTVGTVSSSGLYTAPMAVPSGAVTVQAVSTVDTSKSASTSVTVTAPPPPATPPAPAPAPSDVLFSDGFEGKATGALGAPWQVTRAGANAANVVSSPVASGARAAEFVKGKTGNYVFGTRAFTATNRADLTMKVYLRDNVVSGSATTIVRMVSGASALASSPRYEVAVSKAANGRLSWAVFGRMATGVRSTTLFSTAAPAVNRWYTLSLKTTWDSASSSARLEVSDGTVLVTPAINMSGKRADRVEIGAVWTDSASRLRMTVDDVRVDRASMTSFAMGDTRVNGKAKSKAKKAVKLAARTFVDRSYR